MKLRFSIIIILILTTLAGCWSKKELNTVSIVTGIGIDNGENGEVSATYQILKPSEIKSPSSGKGGGGGGGGRGVWMLTSSGKSIFDALRNAALESDRKLETSQSRAVIIGEETAKSGIGPLLDFLYRDHEFRNLAYVLIARGKAKDILEVEDEQEKIPARGIEGLVKASSVTSKAPKVNLHRIYKTFASKSSDLAIPGIKLFEVKEQDETKRLFRLDDTAVFKKDKLVGWLSEKETRGVLWVIDKVKSGIVVVPSPKDETKEISIEILRASGKVKPEVVNGQLVMTVKVKVKGNIDEVQSQVDVTELEIFKEIEERQQAVIKDEINAALAKAQKEWGTDVFKFGEAVHRKFPKEWKVMEPRWEDVFRKLEVRIEVDAKLQKIGMQKNPKKKIE